MAKKSAIQKNLNKETQVKKNKSRRDRLKAICSNRSLPIEERFEAPLCPFSLRMVHALRARSIYIFFNFVEKSVWERYTRFSVGFDRV